MAAELHLQVSPINFQVDPDSDESIKRQMNICRPASEGFIQWMEKEITDTDLSANDKYRMLRDCDNLRVAHAKEQKKEEENL